MCLCRQSRCRMPHSTALCTTSDSQRTAKRPLAAAMQQHLHLHHRMGSCRPTPTRAQHRAICSCSLQPLPRQWATPANAQRASSLSCGRAAQQATAPQLTQQQHAAAPAPAARGRRLRCVAAELEAAATAQDGGEAPLPSTGSRAPEPASTSSSESSSTSSDSESGSSSSVEDEGPSISIQPVADTPQLQAVAQLRAEAYYADDTSRFALSFKRQFASQEVESLRQRTAAGGSGRPQLCECLVALDAGGRVVGCIDIRLPQTSTGMKTIGVPDGDAAGCYLLNVVVAEDARGRGVGKRLMRAAMARAVGSWGAARLYTHVEAGNEVASGLYKACGFREHSDEAKYANATSLGRLVLLMAMAEDAGASASEALLAVPDGSGVEQRA